MSRGAEEVAAIREKFWALKPTMNEAVRRLWVAAEARSLGRGGQALVSAATGMSLPTIRKGIRELEAGVALSPERVRSPGGGRKPLLVKDPTLLADLEDLLHLHDGSGPELRWSAMLPQRLLRQLQRRGHTLSLPSLLALLSERAYRWHAQPQRPASRAGEELRWRYLAARVQQFLRCNQPVLACELTRGSGGLLGADAAPLGQRSALWDTGPEAAQQLHVHPEISSPAQLGATLRLFLAPLRSRLLHPAGDLLLVVGQSRRRTTPSLWQAECRRLAGELRLRVQLVLMPAGIYRWAALHAPMICQILQPGSRAAGPGPGTPAHSTTIELGVVAPRPPLDIESARRLYQKAYPDGLITDEECESIGDSWSSVPRRGSHH